jgi:hypothetical protein
VVCYFVLCVIHVLYLIVVPLPPAENTFAVNINNNNNNKKKKKKKKAFRKLYQSSDEGGGISSDTYTKTITSITAVLLPFVTYLLSLPRI